MGTLRRRGILAAIVIALVPALLTGCVDAGAVEADVETSMLTIDGVDGALAGMSYDGTARVLGTKLYMPEASPEVVSAAVASAFEQMWHISPVRPVQLWIVVVDAAKPDDASLTDRDGIPLDEVADRLGFDYYGTSHTVFAQADALEATFGPWAGD